MELLFRRSLADLTNLPSVKSNSDALFSSSGFAFVDKIRQQTRDTKVDTIIDDILRLLKIRKTYQLWLLHLVVSVTMSTLQKSYRNMLNSKNHVTTHKI